MRITSTVTYVFPFLMLLFTTAFCTYFYSESYLWSVFGYYDDMPIYLTVGIFSVILSVILFLLFKKQTKTGRMKYFRYLLLAVPLAADLLLVLLVQKNLQIGLDIFCGVFLFTSHALFSNRYVARLTDDAIFYGNLLGQNGCIPLTSITKLEEKKSLLTFIKELKILGISRKMGIAFCDENLDEYEINIFLRVLKNDEIFTKIIQQSNACGNLKIRQYAL